MKTLKQMRAALKRVSNKYESNLEYVDKDYSQGLAYEYVVLYAAWLSKRPLTRLIFRREFRPDLPEARELAKALTCPEAFKVELQDDLHLSESIGIISEKKSTKKVKREKS